MTEISIKKIVRTIPRGFIFKCGYCGKVFEPTKAQIAKYSEGKNVFCCIECSMQFHAKKHGAKEKEISKFSLGEGLSKSKIEALKRKKLKQPNDFLNLKGCNDYG